MSLHNNRKGFTLVEVMISLVVGALVMIGIFSFFGSSINEYFKMQQESVAFADVAANSQRVAKVIRGTTDITSASNNSVTLYSYFSPYDQYVSLITYYPNNTNTKLLADVTKMTANPPTGTQISGSTQTFTIIDNFYLPNGTNTFEYLDSSGSTLSTPISDLRTIKGVRVNLADKPSGSSGVVTKLSVQVSLRNRKTNL
ncbi:MAG: prepilin-type N-terminal cleavage/methylation domain-containing protein [Candidatus Saccharimonadales bacterium]